MHTRTKVVGVEGGGARMPTILRMASLPGSIDFINRVTGGGGGI